ncbi:hypothetical protein ES703_51463 [subsurface metagenome]
MWKRKGGKHFAAKKKGSRIKESPTEKLKKQILQKQSKREKLREAFSRPGMINKPRKAKKLFEEYQRLTEEIEELEGKLSSSSN